MPLVQIKLVGETTQDQRERVISGVTDVLVNELGKPADKIAVIIDEYEPSHWGSNGKSVLARDSTP